MVRLSEGFSPDTPPSMVWDCALLRRERRQAELEALGLSIYASIGTVLGGGDTSEIVKPFYSAREWEEMRQRAEDARQEAAQAAQIAKLKRLSREWGNG